MPQWETRIPESRADAVAMLRDAVVLLHQQIEFHRGDRKKAWDGDYIEHVYGEAMGALKWFEQSRSESNRRQTEDQQRGLPQRGCE